MHRKLPKKQSLCLVGNWHCFFIQFAFYRTEISEAELLDDEISISTSPINEFSEESETRCFGNDTRYLAIPDAAGGRVGRRHSVPLSVPAAPAVPRTIIRRESLAIGEQRTVRLLSAGCLDEGEEELLNLGRRYFI